MSPQPVSNLLTQTLAIEGWGKRYPYAWCQKAESYGSYAVFFCFTAQCSPSRFNNVHVCTCINGPKKIVVHHPNCRPGVSLFAPDATDIAWLEVDLARRVTIAAVVLMIQEQQHDRSSNTSNAYEALPSTWSSVFPKYITHLNRIIPIVYHVIGGIGLVWTPWETASLHRGPCSPAVTAGPASRTRRGHRSTNLLAH